MDLPLPQASLPLASYNDEIVTQWLVDRHRRTPPPARSKGTATLWLAFEKIGQFGDIHSNPSRLILAEQFGPRRTEAPAIAERFLATFDRRGIGFGERFAIRLPGLGDVTSTRGDAIAATAAWAVVIEVG